MSLKSTFTKLIPKRFRKSEDDGPTSMVLLLKQPHLFTREKLRLAAEKAWSRSFDDSEESHHFILQAKWATLVKVGPHLLNVLQHASPYLGLNDADLAEFLPEMERSDAWRAHHAWCAVDYMNKNTDEETKYCVLAALVAEMIDENCAGVWFPKTSGFMPNGVEFNGLLLYPALREIALSKEVRLD
jgi:hypothetical protein